MLDFGLQSQLTQQAGHVLTVRLPIAALQFSCDPAVVVCRNLSDDLSDRRIEHLTIQGLWLAIMRAEREVQHSADRILVENAHLLHAQTTLFPTKS